MMGLPKSASTRSGHHPWVSRRLIRRGLRSCDTFSLTAMNGELAFTNYVEASVRADRPVDGPELEALWIQLRGVLVKELRLRGLWGHSPMLLGIHGAASWTENDGEALEELASDCFSVAVLHRLPAYKTHLKAKANVEGLVFRAIKNFLYDTQKRHDPQGFRVYMFVRTGVRQALEQGRLQLRSGPETITNESVLTFSLTTFHRSGTTETVLRNWSRSTAPDFAAALLKVGKKGREKLGRRFVDRLVTLKDELRRNKVGHGTDFSFKSLVDCWKLECRSLWSAMQEEPTGEGTAIKSPVPTPGSDFEARQAYRALQQCVRDGIENGGEDEKTRDRLHRLLLTFEGHGEEVTVTDRGLERLLGIPRRQIVTLRARLKELATFCSKRGRVGAKR